MNTIRPYLVIPKFIPQPTWGGDYIVNYKHWQDRPELSNQKIGQSYELYGKSLLASDLTNSSDPLYIPDLGQKLNIKVLEIGNLVSQDPQKVLGPKIAVNFKNIPILIKFTQALGNSFQLHVKSSITGEKWLPKPESWFYFEDGYITLGLKDINKITDYRQVCLSIDGKMHELSTMVKKGNLSITEAQKQSQDFIKLQNPWQFVNRLHVPKNCLVDLSGGGIHHSWEEYPDNPSGNIVYEVQVDVPDEQSTLRSFDQGKFKDDGSIRELTIEEYFKNIDNDISHNDPKALIYETVGNHILSTKYYSMDMVMLDNPKEFRTADSFVHLFIFKGSVSLKTDGGMLNLTQGHSCFIPWAVNKYELIPLSQNVKILNTFIEA